MESENARLLFEAVKNDNLKAFSNLVSSNADLKVRFGRFPLLSVCYLYNSYNILSKFEDAMLAHGNYTELPEFYEIYKKFKGHAKKVLKFYVYEEKIVYPAEMLAILNKRDILAFNYKKLYKTEDIVLNIKRIFALNYHTYIEISTAEIKIKKAKLNFKQRLAAAIFATIFAFISLFSVFSVIIVKNIGGLGTSSDPILISTEEEFLSAIEGGKLCYKLTQDISLSKEVNAKTFSGELDGDGHIVEVKQKLESGLVTTLSGTIKNLKLNILSENIEIYKSIGLFANTLTGRLENCEIVGNLNATFVLDNSEETDNTFLSIFACNLTGTIVNSKSNVNVVAKNNSGKNAFVSLVGENSGLIESCENLASKFEADTVDMAGIVISNYGTVIRCKNHAEIAQTTNKEWHPNSSGIVISNEGIIKECENYSKVSSISTLESLSSSTNSNLFAYASGIVVDNVGEISDCKNTGDIYVKTEIAIVYSSGIVCRNLISENRVGRVIGCEAKCNIEGLSNTETYVAGVATVNTGALSSSGFYGTISSSIEHLSFGAGVCSNNRYGTIQNCYSGANFVSDENAVNTYYATLAVFSWDIMVGNINLYSSNNKYLKIEKYPICFNFIGNRYNEVKDDNLCGSKGFNSIEELEDEVNNG